MIVKHTVVVLIASYAVCIVAQDCSVVSDALVFDGLFYLNSNPDLMDAGLSTVEQAREHWCDSGLAENRQASSMFHASQYLERYPDLDEALNGDLRMATEHYVVSGNAEGRIGYTEGGSAGRWTVRSNNANSGSYLYVSTSQRTAGAVDSLVWGNKEFINNYDHGRQFQLAVTVPQYGECWNPTEAGGSADGTGTETFSVLQAISASQNMLQTTNHPAYWLRQGVTAPQFSGDNCQVGDPARNEVPTHPFSLSKNITIGCFGMDNCIEFNMDSHLGSGLGMPTDYQTAQLEAPTAYCMADFTEAKRWNYETGELVDVCEECREQIWPVIIHTPDGNYALGGYTSPSEHLSYAYYDFGIPHFHSGTFKWSIVWREYKLPDEHIVVTSWACVGNLNMVVSCLTNVRNGVMAAK